MTKLKPKNFVPTPYDLATIEVCPASRVFVGPREKPNFAMWHGIFVHRFIEYAQTRGRDAALAYINKKNKRIAEILEVVRELQRALRRQGFARVPAR